MIIFGDVFGGPTVPAAFGGSPGRNLILGNDGNDTIRAG